MDVIELLAEVVAAAEISVQTVRRSEMFFSLVLLNSTWTSAIESGTNHSGFFLSLL